MRDQRHAMIRFAAAALLLTSLAVAAGQPLHAGASSSSQRVSFPADTASHPQVPVEWWYLVGHLSDAAGKSYGFETTLFRFSGLRHYFAASPADTAFRTDVAITDETAHRFYHSITYAVDQPPLTLASTTTLNLRASSISMSTIAPFSYHIVGVLSGGAGGKVDLTVVSQRTPLLENGGWLGWGAGYTYYYSLTHLSATGTLTIGSRHIPVHGTSWMDHQWGDMGGQSITGWDWMEMQLSDHTDLDLVKLRPGTRADSQWAAALLPDNHTSFVQKVEITPLGSWKSPHTGATYPSGWRVQVPGLQLDVIVKPTVLDQEMSDSFQVMGYFSSYWEGSCTITGTRAGRPISGRGYTELTGYASLPPTVHLQ